MRDVELPALDAFLKTRFGPSARLTAVRTMAGASKQGIKEFGYGKPVLVEYELDGQRREAVFSSMRGDKYGHQFYWDRAAILMFQHETSARLPGHARSLALGYVGAGGRLVLCNDIEEFFVLQEKLPGHDYYDDLERIRGGDFRPSDLVMARSLAAWLADIHQTRKADPDLYWRHIRNLIGSSECILGLIDEAYPPDFPDFSAERFLALEKRLLDWRWTLKPLHHRLAQVHGDFHPFNVLTSADGSFGLLDRSRGEWGEPAGDLAAMAVNYLLLGLLMHPGEPLEFRGPFRELWDAFFEEYLARTADAQALEVIGPFFVFRCLVVASPQWYPGHPPAVRQGLLRFMEQVAASDSFSFGSVVEYLH